MWAGLWEDQQPQGSSVPPRSLTPPQDRGTEQRSQSEFLQPYSALGPVETMRRVAPALNGNMSVSHRREIINIKPHG